ncbi:MAG: helix-turn-helix transcriptional regulator [Chloroflexota bacterium]|nr:helix-turn-helix transcriptional regulator [Chloroflexota bacterium]
MAEPLDATALRRLRRLVRELQTSESAALPRARMVQLAKEVDLPPGLTVDFDAAHELGEPMIVVRLPVRPAPHPIFESLSRRELEVAELISEGLPNKDIAGRLCISLGTVKDHVHHILEKTGLASRTEIAAAFLGAL